MVKHHRVNPGGYSNADVINGIRHANNRMAHEVPAADGTLQTNMRIGDIITGDQAFTEHFTGMLTQLAKNHISSRHFLEYYKTFTKGNVTHGGLIAEYFINTTKAQDFAPAKANKREFSRVRPDIDRAIHKTNWRAQYQATISDRDIARAMSTENGVLDLISRLVTDLTSGANLDHKMLTEYTIKRAILNGLTKPVVIDPADNNDFAIKQRATASLMAGPSKAYNSNGSYTYSPPSDLHFVIDAMAWATQDVEVLANRFNADKASFLSNLIVIPSWTEFDFDRFAEVNEEHHQLDVFTPAEIEKLGQVRGAIFDTEALQFYNVTETTTDKFSASGLHTNYFHTVEKIYGISPFSNFVTFVTPEFEVSSDTPITATVTEVVNTDQTSAVSVHLETGLVGQAAKLIQTDEATEGHVLVLDSAVVYSSAPGAVESIILEAESGGREFVSDLPLSSSAAVGEVLTLTPR